MIYTIELFWMLLYCL